MGGHTPLTSSTIKDFITTQHYNYYLCAEHADGKLTLIDATKETERVMLGDVVSAPSLASRRVAAIARTAALGKFWC